MKKILFLAFIVSACATPKYTYNFSHYRENMGSAAVPPGKSETHDAVSTPAVASINPEPAILPESSSVNTEIGTKEIETKSIHLTREQKKEFKTELKKEVKEYRAAVKRGDAANVKKTGAMKAMDHDLKLAAIFGAVGLVALIISGDVFYIIGGISLIIGIVFFVMWLSRQ